MRVDLEKHSTTQINTCGINLTLLNDGFLFCSVLFSSILFYSTVYYFARFYSVFHLKINGSYLTGWAVAVNTSARPIRAQFLSRHRWNSRISWGRWEWRSESKSRAQSCSFHHCYSLSPLNVYTAPQSVQCTTKTLAGFPRFAKKLLTLRSS